MIMIVIVIVIVIIVIVIVIVIQVVIIVIAIVISDGGCRTSRLGTGGAHCAKRARTKHTLVLYQAESTADSGLWTLH